MKIETLKERAIQTASDIWFTEQQLKKIALLYNHNWIKRETTDQEEFDKIIKKNKDSYKKLKKYRELISDKTIDGEITIMRERIINDIITRAIDGTF